MAASFDFDLFVIGGGSGGVACARRAASHGARVGLCESYRVGGTCVIRGCIPKKLMRYGALFHEHFEAAKGYGWRTSGLEHDWPSLIAARDREIDRLNTIYLRMLENAGVRLFVGRGQVLGPHSVEVAGERFTAERILIAVGAYPSLIELPGIEHAIVSDEMLERMPAKPRRIVVMGAGYIGIELAGILNGLGVETSLLFRRKLVLHGFDDDLRQFMQDQMAARGLDVRPETVIERIERQGDGVVAHSSAGPIAADAVLFATGRAPIPRTHGIGLEALDVAMTRSGAIKVDAGYRSSQPSIYAVGDCSDHAHTGIDSGHFDLTPVAIAEGRAIAETLFNDHPLQVNYATVPTAVFGLPEAAAVGLTEWRARELGYDVQIYQTSFRPLLHTLTDLPVRVFMKLVVDRASDRVLGCHMVGDDAGEIMQGLAVALTAGATKAEFDATVGLHPSAAEEFVTMYQPRT